MKKIASPTRSSPRSRDLSRAAGIIVLAMMAISGSTRAEDLKERKPIAHGRLAGVGPAKPIYAEDLSRATPRPKSESADVMPIPQLSQEKDAIEMRIPGVISAARFDQETARHQKTFSACTAAMRSVMNDPAKAATAEEKQKLADCLDHCERLLAQTESARRGAGHLSSATRQAYILDGESRLKALLASAAETTKTCPQHLEEGKKCCEVASK